LLQLLTCRMMLLNSGTQPAPVSCAVDPSH